MSEMHQLRVSAENKAAYEQVSPEFILEGLLKARDKTFEVLQEIRSQLREGVNERQARLITLSTFADHGVKKHWHLPYIRFGEGSLLTFHDPISEDQLKPNDIFHMDLGPVWPSEALGLGVGLEYEGDCGDSFVFGENPTGQKMIDTLHELFGLAVSEWRKNQPTGEVLYQFLKEQTEKRGYKMMERVDGHRVSEFPHHKYTRDSLSRMDFTPTDSLWVLELMICKPELKMGAFYENLLRK